MTTGTGDVAFDFDGALQLARSLYDVSIWLEGALDDRSGAASEASLAWRGPLGDQFRLQAAADDDEARRLAASLHGASIDWAQAWADAMTEQNRRNRGRRVAELAAERSWAEHAVDLVSGRDPSDRLPPAEQVPRPHSPDYLPTARLQEF
ncbi:MAG: hypothetical protein R2761_25600 [Acidimicrobiales bacterium]